MEMPKLKIQIFAREAGKSESAVFYPGGVGFTRLKILPDLVHVQRVLVS